MLSFGQNIHTHLNFNHIDKYLRIHGLTSLWLDFIPLELQRPSDLFSITCERLGLAKFCMLGFELLRAGL